jgi:hypothetical protein
MKNVENLNSSESKTMTKNHGTVKQSKILSVLLKKFSDKQFFWAFIWGIMIALIIIVFGGYILSSFGFEPFANSLELDIVILILSITTGLYFASFWSEEDNSQAILLGFSAVIFLSMLVIFYRIRISDVLIALGFLFGFSFVRSGAIDKSINVISYLKKFFKKFTWYVLGLQVTASYEIPMFNKILITKNYLSLNFIVGIVIAVLFIAFVVLINRYIKIE